MNETASQWIERVTGGTAIVRSGGWSSDGALGSTDWAAEPAAVTAIVRGHSSGTAARYARLVALRRIRDGRATASLYWNLWRLGELFAAERRIGKELAWTIAGRWMERHGGLPPEIRTADGLLLTHALDLDAATAIRLGHLPAVARRHARTFDTVRERVMRAMSALDPVVRDVHEDGASSAALLRERVDDLRARLESIAVDASALAAELRESRELPSAAPAKRPGPVRDARPVVAWAMRHRYGLTPTEGSDMITWFAPRWGAESSAQAVETMMRRR